MASSGWQGDVTLTDGGFGYSYFKGNLRIDSIYHSGGTVTVTGAFGVHNDGGPSSYYIYPINAKVDDSTDYQQVVAGNQWIANGEWVTSAVTFTFNSPATSTTASIHVLWSYNNGQAGNAITYNLNFDPAVSPPTGLDVTGVTVGAQSVKATVSVTGWGGAGDASSRYRELQVWASNMSGDRRYQAAFGDTLSGDITCTNSSSGTLTITPNTKYWIGGYASNGTLNTGSQPFGTAITNVPTAGAALSATTVDTATINYSIANQGGERDIKIDQNLDSGGWTNVTTLSGSGAKTGSFTITGLLPNSSHSTTVRSSAVGGSVAGGTTVNNIITKPPVPVISFTSRAQTSLTLGYSIPNQGGAQSIALKRKLGSGSWVNVETITASGSKSGSFTISSLAPNTTYTVASETVTTTGTTTGNTLSGLYTAVPTPVMEAGAIGKNSATINYYVPQQGGAQTIYVEYSLDGGAWTTVDTITTSGEKYGSFTLNGFAPNTSHTVQCRIRSGDGATQVGDPVAFVTHEVYAKMYCSVNNTAKTVKKVYCSVGGARKRVTKIYGSVNGQRKLMWEEP